MKQFTTCVCQAAFVSRHRSFKTITGSSKPLTCINGIWFFFLFRDLWIYSSITSYLISQYFCFLENIIRILSYLQPYTGLIFEMFLCCQTNRLKMGRRIHWYCQYFWHFLLKYELIISICKLLYETCRFSSLHFEEGWKEWAVSK